MKNVLLKSTQGTLIAVSLSLMPLNAAMADESANSSNMQQEQTRFPYMNPDIPPPAVKPEPKGAQGPIREDNFSTASKREEDSNTRHEPMWLTDPRYQGN